MHDMTDQSHWHEPEQGVNAGTGAFKRAAMPYDRFMEAEGVPIFRGIGVKRVHDLPMKPWVRLGGKGTYIQLYGTEGLWGMYVVEIPPGGALKVGASYLREGRLYRRGTRNNRGVERRTGEVAAIRVAQGRVILRAR